VHLQGHSCHFPPIAGRAHHSPLCQPLQGALQAQLVASGAPTAEAAATLLDTITQLSPQTQTPPPDSAGQLHGARSAARSVSALLASGYMFELAVHGARTMMSTVQCPAAHNVGLSSDSGDEVATRSGTCADEAAAAALLALAFPAVPLTRDPTADAASATVAVLLHGPLHVLARSLGSVAVPPVPTNATAPYLTPHPLDALPPQPHQASHLCASFVHMLWSVPAVVLPALLARLKPLLATFLTSPQWHPVGCTVPVSTAHPAHCAISTLAMTTAVPELLPSRPGDPCSHELMALLFESRWQVVVIEQAVATVEHAYDASGLSWLQFAAAKVRGHVGLGPVPHMAVLELVGLLRSTAAVCTHFAAMLVHDWLAKELGGWQEWLVEVRSMLAQLGVLLHVVHEVDERTTALDVHSACTPADFVHSLPRIAHAVHTLGAHWRTLTPLATRLPEDARVQLSVSLAAASKALSLEWAAPAAQALRLHTGRAFRLKPPAKSAAIWGCLMASRVEETQGLAALQPARDESDMGAAACGPQACEDAPWQRVRVHADVPLRRTTVRALALCIAEAVVTGACEGASDVIAPVAALWQARLQAVRSGSDPPPSCGSSRAVFAAGAAAIAGSARSPAAAAAACRHSRLLRGGPADAAVASALAAATAASATALPAAAANAVERGAAAAAAATARTAGEAALLQALAWSIANNGSLPEGVLTATWAAWHTAATAPQLPLATADDLLTPAALLPASFKCAVATTTPSALAALQALGVPGHLHTSSTTHRAAALASRTCMALSNIPTRRVELMQAAHAAIALGAATCSSRSPPPLATELALLSASAAHTVTAFVPLCGASSAPAKCPVATLAAAFAAAASGLAAGESAAVAVAAAAAAASCPSAFAALASTGVSALAAYGSACADLSALLAAQCVEGSPQDDAIRLAETAAAWVALGCCRAFLLLPPKTLDPAAGPAEEIHTLRHEAEHAIRPALFAARFGAPLPLLPCHDMLLAHLRAREALTADAVSALTKRLRPRADPSRYTFVAAGIHRFVHGVLQRAASPLVTARLRSLQGAQEVEAAREWQAVLAQWCVESARDEDYADILTPIIIAARDVERGLSLLCTAAELRDAQAEFAAAAVCLSDAVSDLLVVPRELVSYSAPVATPPAGTRTFCSPPRAPFGPQSLRFEEQTRLITRLVIRSSALDPIEADTLQRHLTLMAWTQYTRESVMEARWWGRSSEGDVRALMQGLHELADEMARGQESIKAAKEAQESLFKQKGGTRCVDLDSTDIKCIGSSSLILIPPPPEVL
jgi:hypothetical protein